MASRPIACGTRRTVLEPGSSVASPKRRAACPLHLEISQTGRFHTANALQNRQQQLSAAPRFAACCKVACLLSCGVGGILRCGTGCLPGLRNC
eukprot:1442678-Pleurochrysis_carterae.AAC.1